MVDQLKCTAWHEAGHVVALWRSRVSALTVEVDTESSGSTVPDASAFDALDDKDAVLVVRAGLEAESSVNPDYNVDEFHRLLLGASCDRRLIYRNYRVYWENLGITGWQGAEHRAKKFIQDNECEIRKIAMAILGKPGFPKRLGETEIQSLLDDNSIR